MILSRRTFLSLAGAASAVAPARAQPAPDLGAIGHQHGVVFGSAFDREIFSDAGYRTLIAANCRVGAIENSLKFDWLRRTGPEADFSAADRLVAFATQANMAVRGTALIWNDWAPDWLKAMSAGEVGAMLDRHVEETVSRYTGRMQGWDVVNEPFYPPHGREGGYRKGPWFDSLGKSYVARAFQRAAAADANARLVLNEAFCEQDDELGRSIRPRLLAQVRDLKQAGIKLDGVGFQAHLKPHLPFDDQAFAAYLGQIAENDVDIYITELDVDDSSLPDDIKVRDRLVAERYGNFLSAALSVPRVKTVICWHLSDRYSWYAKTDWYAKEIQRFGGDPARVVRTHLADANLRPKAAWSAVGRAMSRRRG